MYRSNIFDKLVSKPGRYLIGYDAQAKVGTHNSVWAAKTYNRRRYSSRCRLHAQAFAVERDVLLRENGGDATVLPRIRMFDGWARDDSGTLPHLAPMLAELEALIEESGGNPSGSVQQPFLRNLVSAERARSVRTVLDFLTSSEVLATAMDHLKTIPVLSKTRPPGVRIMQSSRALDPDADGPFRDSQLYHLDYHDSPLVYVLVAMRDIPQESGPWTFLPASVSARAAKKLGYQKRGVNFRVTDEQMAGVIEPGSEVRFIAKKGDVLFINSSACFHYGSRNSVVPRFQLMCAFTSPARTDFSMAFQAPEIYPLPKTPSRLQRLVLEPW
jgi:hypothetical protein